MGSKRTRMKRRMEKRPYIAIAKALATGKWLLVMRRIVRESGFISNALALTRRRARTVRINRNLSPMSRSNTDMFPTAKWYCDDCKDGLKKGKFGSVGGGNGK